MYRKNTLEESLTLMVFHSPLGCDTGKGIIISWVMIHFNTGNLGTALKATITITNYKQFQKNINKIRQMNEWYSQGMQASTKTVSTHTSKLSTLNIRTQSRSYRFYSVHVRFESYLYNSQKRNHVLSLEWWCLKLGRISRFNITSKEKGSTILTWIFLDREKLIT